MIAQDPVGHGHFGRQGLQRIKPLVGVVDSSLEWLILLLEGFLIVAKSVVVANFPEHPRIRAHRRRYTDGPNKGQDRETVQHIRGHDKLSELTGRRRDIERIALTPHAYRASQAFKFDVLRANYPGASRGH